MKQERSVLSFLWFGWHGLFFPDQHQPVADFVGGVEVNLLVRRGVSAEARGQAAHHRAAAIVRGAQQQAAVLVEDRGVELRLGAADQRRGADLLAVQRHVRRRSVVVGEVHLRTQAEGQRVLRIDLDAGRQLHLRCPGRV